MEFKFNADGLIPVITQDFQTKEVLMLGYMNEEAYAKTMETKKVHYFSRSRQTLWLKGETSGHFQLVKEMFVDCDQDTILIFVEQVGGACHTGHKTCFFTNIETGADVSDIVFDEQAVYSKQDMLSVLYDVILDRQKNPKEGSYTNYLFDKGIDKILKKVGEENAEVIIASKNNDKAEIVYEASDLMYHLSVLMVQTGVCWNDIYAELKKRHVKE